MRTMRRQEIVFLVNRTLRPLEVMDDGVPITLKPGYRKLDDGRVIGAGAHGQPIGEPVALATANRAMDQNKKRGTVNPDDTLDCVFLCGVNGRDDISYVEDNTSDDDELIDRSMLPEAARAVKMQTGLSRRRTRRDRESGAGVTPTPAGVMALEDGGIRSGVGGEKVGGAYVASDS